jgi:hypothetical protein
MYGCVSVHLEAAIVQACLGDEQCKWYWFLILVKFAKPRLNLSIILSKPNLNVAAKESKICIGLTLPLGQE